MRSILLRLAILFTLAAILGGHVAELFDRWDNTLQTGKDADYTIVVVAACTGFVFAVMGNLVLRFRRYSLSGDSLGEAPFSMMQSAIAETSTTGPSPPPLLPMRI